MSIAPTHPGPASTGRRLRPGRTARALAAIALVAVVLVAGYAAYAYWSSRPPVGESTLVVYTYASLFGGSCSSPIFDTVFGGFERAHHVHLQVECPAGNLANALLNQRNAPIADVVIGLDEITTPQAAKANLLVPFVPSSLHDVSSTLVNELSPDHHATPYEFGYLAVDYTAGFLKATNGAVAVSAFPSFAQNQSWAKNLLIETPTVDITGEEFLAWQIQFYSQVLHQDWKTFWHSVGTSVPMAADWGAAFSEFNATPTSPQMVVSYTTDPAYAAYSGTPGTFNSTVSNWNGVRYGWKTIYGIGIVNGSQHLSLDRQLIDWFLTGTVQSQIPTNEWEYPANSTVALPAVFGYALDPTTIHALNDGTTPAAIAQALPGWLNDWQTIENGP